MSLEVYLRPKIASDSPVSLPGRVAFDVAVLQFDRDELSVLSDRHDGFLCERE
jgi:hypothetical protein